MTEHWIPVPLPDYAHLYEVSDLGRVRCTRPWPHLFHRIRQIKVKQKTGYYEVVLCRYNLQKKFRVHKLVIEAFVGPCPKGKNVNHKDGVKAHNALENLEYVTPKENILHAERTGLRQSFGEHNCKAKLTEALVQEIRESKETSIAIAKRLNLHKATIYRVKWRKSWGHLK